MLDRILDEVLSVQGVSILSYVILVFAALLYCRIVTGEGLFRMLRSIPALAAGGVDTAGKSLSNKHLPNMPQLHSQDTSYDEITMDGGDGRGTVSEILARQTEMQIMQGETINEDFIEEVSPQYTKSTSVRPVQTKTVRSTQVQIDAMPVAPTSPVSPDMPIHSNQYEGFSVGDSYSSNS